MYKKIPLLIVMILGLQACVYTPSQKSLSVLEITGKIPASCNLLGQVFGESHIPYLAVGVEVAKSRAKMQAAKLGATHIIWEEISYSMPLAVGRAYRCD